jgi:hypothetical protein
MGKVGSVKLKVERSEWKVGKTGVGRWKSEDSNTATQHHNPLAKRVPNPVRVLNPDRVNTPISAHLQAQVPAKYRMVKGKHRNS